MDDIGSGGNRKKRSGGNKVALADVAKAAGVSTATVSLALQDSPRISEATRERVRQATKATGYRYNRNAAKLRTGQSRTVGLIITDIANPFFAALAAGVETELDSRGYMAFLVNSNDKHDRQERQISTLLEHGVDGLLLSPADGSDVEGIARFVSNGMPLVQVSRWLSGLPCDIVAPDNESLAAEATRHLLALGHRRIAFLGGSEGRSARIERVAGYRRSLEEAGLTYDPALTPTAVPTRANGAELLKLVTGIPNPPTAALCYHDLMALGALEAAKELGLKVGKDFALIGFDDIVEASLSDPPLTTVRINATALGSSAAECLLSRIEGDVGSPRRIVIPASLVIRASCGARGDR